MGSKLASAMSSGADRQGPQWDWAGHAVDAFSSRLSHLAGRSLSVAYGSDCSGAEAPLFALKALGNQLQCLCGTTVDIKHEFAPGPRPGGT